MILGPGAPTLLESSSASTYSGGTRVWTLVGAGLATDFQTYATSADVLGTGNITVEYGGLLNVYGASNMGASAR